MTEEATIRRGARNARYTAVPNHVFEDQRLSMEARWLLGYLLSKPDGWIVRLGDIRKRGGCGRDKARSMVGELVEAGYAEKEAARKDDGKFNGLSLVIYDEPISAPSVGVASLPQTEKPATAEPSPVQPSPVNPPLVNTESTAIPESSERESGREGEKPEDRPGTSAFEKRVARFCSGKGFLAGAWKNWDGASLTWIGQQFAALSPAERLDAERWRDPFLTDIAARKTDPPPVGVWLRGKTWTALDPAILQRFERRSSETPSKPNVAPPWGPDWAQMLFAALLAEPIDPGPVEMTRERRSAAFETMRSMIGAEKAEAHYRRMGHEVAVDGSLIFPDNFEARIAREHLQAKGWPRANDLLRAAAEGKVSRLDARFEPRRELLEAVPVGLSRWREWHEEFARRGWPPMPDPGRQPVVFFPVGGPEMLATFELAVRGGNDAGRSEAAE